MPRLILVLLLFLLLGGVSSAQTSPGMAASPVVGATPEDGQSGGTMGVQNGPG